MQYTSYRIIKHILKVSDFVELMEEKKVPYTISMGRYVSIKFKINANQMGKYNPKF